MASKAPDIDDPTTWPREASEPWVQMTKCDDAPEMWENDRYWVRVERGLKGPWGGQMIRLGIQSIDQTARHDWREFQKIKNDICGNESEAVELYPAESRLLDPSNYYLLWVFPAVVPIGVFSGRKVCNDGSVPQRAFA